MISTIKSSIVLLSIMACLAATLTVSCRQPENPLPAPTPVAKLYRGFEQEKSSNPTRLESRVDRNEVYAFSGNISNIDGDTIQFLVDEKMLERDAFVECQFPSESYVLQLNVGQEVTVYGKLTEAFQGGLFGITGDSRAVKFHACGFYPQAKQHRREQDYKLVKS